MSKQTLRDAVEAAYREGWNVALGKGNYSPDQAWNNSHARGVLAAYHSGPDIPGVASPGGDAGGRAPSGELHAAYLVIEEIGERLRLDEPRGYFQQVEDVREIVRRALADGASPGDGEPMDDNEERAAVLASMRAKRNGYALGETKQRIAGHDERANRYSCYVAILEAMIFHIEGGHHRQATAITPADIAESEPEPHPSLPGRHGADTDVVPVPAFLEDAETVALLNQSRKQLEEACRIPPDVYDALTATKAPTQSTHHSECWREHLECAVQRVEEMARRIAHMEEASDYFQGELTKTQAMAYRDGQRARSKLEKSEARLAAQDAEDSLREAATPIAKSELPPWEEPEGEWIGNYKRKPQPVPTGEPRAEQVAEAERISSRLGISVDRVLYAALDKEEIRGNRHAKRIAELERRIFGADDGELVEAVSDLREEVQVRIKAEAKVATLEQDRDTWRRTAEKLESERQDAERERDALQEQFDLTHKWMEETRHKDAACELVDVLLATPAQEPSDADQ